MIAYGEGFLYSGFGLKTEIGSGRKQMAEAEGNRWRTRQMQLNAGEKDIVEKNPGFEICTLCIILGSGIMWMILPFFV